MVDHNRRLCYKPGAQWSKHQGTGPAIRGPGHAQRPDPAARSSRSVAWAKQSRQEGHTRPHPQRAAAEQGATTSGIAALYNQLDQAATPHTIVTLRVSLRERRAVSAPDNNGTQSRNESSASSGETERESRGARLNAPVREGPKRKKKRRMTERRKVRLTPEDIVARSTIPRARKARTAAPHTREQEVQTMSRRRQGYIRSAHVGFWFVSAGSFLESAIGPCAHCKVQP